MLWDWAIPVAGQAVSVWWAAKLTVVSSASRAILRVASRASASLASSGRVGTVSEPSMREILLWVSKRSAAMIPSRRDPLRSPNRHCASVNRYRPFSHPRLDADLRLLAGVRSNPADPGSPPTGPAGNGANLLPIGVAKGYGASCLRFRWSPSQTEVLPAV